MKLTSAFRLKQDVKRMAATMLDKNERRQYMKTMMQAQLSHEAAARQPLKIKDVKDKE